MKFSTLLISISFSLLLFSGCKKSNDNPNPIIKDSIPFENEDIKLEFTATTSFIALDFHFFNASTGIAVTEDGKIYRTENAGVKWKVQYTSSPAIPLNQILFTSPDVGYVVGGSNSCSGNGCSIPGGYILKTVDGGLTWQKILSVPDVEFSSIATNASGELFAACNAAAIFKSTDAGNNWSLINNIPVHLYKIAFNKNVGICTAQGNKLLISTDNGNTWQLSDSLSNVFYTSSTAFNNDNGYLIADYQKIFKTTDNGNSWTLSLNEKNGRPWTLHVVNNNECVSFGAGSYSGGDFGTFDGAGWITKDAGLSWKYTEFGNTGLITNSSFYTATEGYIQAGSELIKVTIK